MNAKIFCLAVIALVALLGGGVGQASAASCTSLTSSNGGTTLTGATNVGTVSSTGCSEIGPFTTTLGTNLGPPASVSNTINPSIYEFTWGGGNLTIQEELGDNGIGNIINVELGLSGVTLNTDHTLSSNVASTNIPFDSTGGPPVFVLNDQNLAAGTYFLDTYLGPCAPDHTCSAGTGNDPVYSVLFTPVSATPLPATLPLFAGGLGFVGYLAGRRKRKAASRPAAA